MTLAKDLESAIRGDLARGKHDIYQKQRTITLDELWSRYLEHVKDEKKSWKADLSRYVCHIQPALGNRPLDKITPLDLERLKIELKKANSKRDRAYTPATIKHILITIRRLFNVARKWNIYTGPNPMDSVDLPKVDNTIIRFLSEDEKARLAAVLEAWPCKDTVDLVRFAMLTGFRRGELMKLKWDHVDFSTGLVTLHQPKGGRTVSVPISDAALDVLRGRDSVNEFVFPGTSGAGRTYFSAPWRRIAKAAGLENFRFHDLRHNFASQLVSAGTSINVIRELLTHKDISTSMKYAHLAPGAVQAAAKASAAIITGTGAEVVSLEGRKNGKN